MPSRSTDEPSPLQRLHGHALPGDRQHWPRDRQVETRHMRLDVRLDFDNRAIDATVTHHVAALNDGLGAIDLDAADMTIAEVKVAGSAVDIDYDGQRLRVPIQPALNRGDEVRVAVTYRAQPRIGLYFVGPDEAYPDKPRQVWSQCQDEDAHYWIPCFDHPNGKQTTEMIVTVPGDWFALSNGRLLDDKHNADGTRTLHWHQDRPHSIYLVTLAAGVFERIDASAGNALTVDYYVEPGTEEDAVRAFQHTPDMITMLEEVTGVAYPWSKYSQIVVRDFVFGGMENTSATTMTELLLLDEKATVDATSDYLVSHELAHMWFGDLLTCRDWSHGWLNEGFATYTEALWEERHRGIDGYRQYMVDMRHDHLEDGDEYQRPIVSNVFRDPIDIFDTHLYEKGGLVLHALRGVLGDDAFFRSVRRYVSANQERNVVTPDLVDAIEAETGRNLDWFFDQWVMRPGHPELEVSWSWDGAQKLATVKVRQIQDLKNGAAIFRAPVTIDFWRGGVKAREYRVELSEAEHHFALPVDRHPDFCRFDPYGWTPAKVRFERSPAELRAQLRDDDDLGGRQFAAADLGRKGGSSDSTAALERALRTEAAWGVQRAAARALGAIHTTAARDALIANLGVEHPKARRAVVEALGEFTSDATVLDAIAPLSRDDASWYVEAEANRSAGKLRVEGAFDLITSNMERRSFREVVHVGCLDGLAALRDERGIDTIMASARYGEPQPRRAPALRAAARLVAFFEHHKARLAVDIAAYLHDPDFRIRIAAARALKDLGRVEQAAALDAMAARELDGRAVRVARQAAITLRERSSRDSEVQQLHDDLEAMRHRYAGLEEAIAELRARAPSGD